MPKISYEDQTFDNTNSGLLSIDIEKQHNYTDYTKLFTDFVKNNNIDIPTLSESSDNVVEYNKIIHSILEDIITNPANPDNQNILDNCLNILGTVHKNGDHILLSSTTEQLIKLLTNASYQKYSAAICEVLIAGKYELTHEQSLHLNEAATSTKSSHIIELLVTTGNISNAVIDNITKGIKDSKAEDVESLIYRDQLLIIAKSLKSNELLKDQVLPSLLEIFKFYKDKSFVSALVKIIDDKNTFVSILKETTNNLEAIATLFKIDHKIIELKKQHNNHDILATKNELRVLLNKVDIIITNELITFVTKFFGNESKALLKDHYKEITDKNTVIKIMTEELEVISRVLNNKIPLTEDFLIAYQKYLKEILYENISNLSISHYQAILKNNINICSLLLHHGCNISQAIVEDLINNIYKNLNQNCSYINNIFTILSILNSQNKISSASNDKIFNIFKKCITLQQPVDVPKTIRLFEDIASNNSHNHEICEGYLNKLIELGCSKLTELLINAEQNELVRVETLKLLHKIIGSIDDANITKISKILIAEKKVIKTDFGLDEVNFDELIHTKYEVINHETAHTLLFLIKDYVLTHNKLPTPVIDILQQALKDEKLQPKILEILDIIAGKTPDLLSPELFDYIKKHVQQVDHNIADNINLEKVPLNETESKLENKGEVLLKKLIDLNPELSSKLNEYQTILDQIHSIYFGSSQQEAISNWNAAQIKDWAINFKTNNESNIIANDNSKDEIAKVIAILERANNLYTAKNGKEGHLLRDTQIISLLLLLDVELNNQGKLLQVATGEGKSTISAMLAAILALQGIKIDLVTSSKVLANTGYLSAKGFFEMLGLSVGLNTEKTALKGRKPCYNCDIVYGDALSFEADFLSNTSHQSAKRGDRGFSTVIVDEVDSMLLDSSNNIAKQSSPTPLMEYLLPILVIAWDNFKKIIEPLNLDQNTAIEKTKELIEALIDQVPIPKHLENYAKFQAENWAISLIGAAYTWQLDQDYVINIDTEGKKVINPVDNSTGVTQENMVWQNGLHQFLQIKHNCRISPEGLTTFFITNISYFLKYERILGMTGTLGSSASQEFLKAIYKVDLSYVPPYKDKQIIELPGHLEYTIEEFREAVCDSSYKEAILHNRAVLIVCQTIQEAEYFCKILASKYGDDAKIINYSRSEEKLYNIEIEQLVRPRTIIVATNLAGRGTDIRTSFEVEENGGLHVIATFIAKNARDEEQIKGRTGRQGNKGSYQIIALEENYLEYESAGFFGEEAIIAVKKQIRDGEEQESITEGINHKVPSLRLQDELYSKFSQLYLKLIGSNFEVGNSKDAKIQQLIENFGLWFKTRKEDDSAEKFLSTAEAKYHKGEFTNPSYLVTQHYGINDGRAVIAILEKALVTNDIYNFAAHYYIAKGWINIGKLDQNYRNHAIDALMEAGNKLSELISYLTAMNISVVSDTSSDNELLQQITNKIEFFQNLLASIESGIKVIQDSQGKEVKVKIVKSKNELSPNLSKADISELDFIGIETIFELEQYKQKQKWQATIFVGCCAIIQMVAGVCIAIGTLGGGITLASGVFVEGLMDAYKVAMAASQGQAIKLEGYLTSKAINYAIIGAQVGFSKMANGAKAGAEGAKQVGGAVLTEEAKTLATQVGGMGTKELVTKTIIELAKCSGTQLAKMIAIEKVTELASKAVNDNALSGLDKKIENAVAETAANTLNRNAILLANESNIEHGQILRQVHQACCGITKTSKHTRIINELAGGVFSAAGSHYPVGAALYSLQRTAVTVDAIVKIQPLIDEIKQQVENIINKAAETASNRLKGKTISGANQEALRQSLSHNIGKTAASAILDFINRKVTTPIIGQLTSKVMNSFLEDFQAKQHKTLDIYSEAANKKLAGELDNTRTRGPAVSAGEEEEESIWIKIRKRLMGKSKKISPEIADEVSKLSDEDLINKYNEINHTSFKNLVFTSEPQTAVLYEFDKRFPKIDPEQQLESFCKIFPSSRAVGELYTKEQICKEPLDFLDLIHGNIAVSSSLVRNTQIIKHEAIKQQDSVTPAGSGKIVTSQKTETPNIKTAETAGSNPLIISSKQVTSGKALVPIDKPAVIKVETSTIPDINVPSLIYNNPVIDVPVMKTFNVKQPIMINEIESLIKDIPPAVIAENYGSLDRFVRNIDKDFTADSVKLFHGTLQDDMWLINFHDGATPLGQRSLAWQTTMAEGTSYKAVEDMLQRLALKYPEWGERNSATISKIPKGTRVTYLEGFAEEQIMKMSEVEKGLFRKKFFEGGGNQYKFRDFDLKWIREYNIPLPEIMKTIGSKKK